MLFAQATNYGSDATIIFTYLITMAVGIVLIVGLANRGIANSTILWLSIGLFFCPLPLVIGMALFFFLGPKTDLD